MDVETLSAYYQNENPRDESELIWGKFTDAQWERMTCEERAVAIFEHDTARATR